MTAPVPGRKKWFVVLFVGIVWISLSTFIAMPRVPRPDLPLWTASRYAMWGLLIYAAFSVSLGYLKVIRPGVLGRRLQSRAQGQLSREKLSERIVKTAVVFPLVPMLAGFIAVFLTGSLSSYWLFVLLAAGSGVAYWRRTGQILRAIDDEQTFGSPPSAG